MAVPPGRQLVIFSADSARPSLADLSGLLIGPGLVSRMGGTARVSVLADSAWRVHALAAEFAARGLAIAWEPGADGGYWVRTSYSTALIRLTTPSFLDGARLRLWFMAAGVLEEDSILLGLGNNHALARPALAPLGLDGEVVTPLAIRISGESKRARLAELIGECPSAAPVSAWPAPASKQPSVLVPQQTVHRHRVRVPAEGQDPFQLQPDVDNDGALQAGQLRDGDPIG